MTDYTRPKLMEMLQQENVPIEYLLRPITIKMLREWGYTNEIIRELLDDIQRKAGLKRLSILRFCHIFGIKPTDLYQGTPPTFDQICLKPDRNVQQRLQQWYDIYGGYTTQYEVVNKRLLFQTNLYAYTYCDAVVGKARRELDLRYIAVVTFCRHTGIDATLFFLAKSKKG